MPTQHTPGPWEFVLNESGVRNNGGFICFLPKPTRYTGQDERYEEDIKEWECNAHLIAAAPELLEACRSAFILLSNMAPENPETKAVLKSHSTRLSCLNTLHTAIEKATGN